MHGSIKSNGKEQRYAPHWSVFAIPNPLTVDFKSTAIPLQDTNPKEHTAADSLLAIVQPPEIVIRHTKYTERHQRGDTLGRTIYQPVCQAG